MFSTEEKIKWFAIISRISVFILQVVANYLVTDHNAKVFRKPLPPYYSSYIGGFNLDILTRGLTHWDAEYFLHIADYGYTYENTLAFFPFYPLVVRFLGNVFQILTNNIFYFTYLPYFLSKHSSIVLMALLVNNVLFVHCALTLHKLTLKVTNNERMSYMASLLFCVNPASIFFSAAYSETLFCFLSFNSMLSIESGNLVTGSFLCGLSGITRSNGLINIGYIFYRALKSRRGVSFLLFSFLVTAICVLIALLPFISFQMYSYSKFCLSHDNILPSYILKFAQENKYILPGNSSLWCKDKYPFAYSYVQKHYWEVGFLQYFEKKQLPNFGLAAPMLLFILYGIYRFVRFHKWKIFYLGLLPGNNVTLPTTCFPYFLHLLFLACFGFFCMHVQVTTRLICAANPAFYWICADLAVKDMCETKEEIVAKKMTKKVNAFYERQENLKSKWRTVLLSERFLKHGLLVRYYFFAYFLAGASIFPNNLPWT